MSTQMNKDKDLLMKGDNLNKELAKADLNSGMGAASGAGDFSRDFKETTTLSNAPKLGGSGIAPGAGLDSREPIIEKTFEKPIVVTHQEKAAFKESYEGQEIKKHDLATDVKTHVAAPIIKEIHQDVIHEHHQDVTVEHKKDILHEHHQKVVHEHVQPVITEKHIHEHHQPIIHEKHETLIQEKHVPIIHEQHVSKTDKETKEAQVHEVLEKPIVKKVEEKPVITQTNEKPVVLKDGADLKKTGNLDAASLKTTKLDKDLGAGLRDAKAFDKEGVLLEDEEWVTGEDGSRKKQKRGFFGQLKDAIIGPSDQK